MIKFIKKIISNYLPLNSKNYHLDLDKETYKYSYLINRPLEAIQKLNFQDLCLLFQTDKASFNHQLIKSKKYYRSILQTHNYAASYDKFFYEIKDSIKNLIEIGCLNGSSSAVLFYYFKYANIFSLDIDFSANNVHSKRISREIVDQSNVSSIRRFIDDQPNTKFNIIIDDGSHKQNDILLTFNEFFDSLSSRSFYIIEDLSYQNQPKVLNIYDQFILKNIGSINYLDKVSFNRIKNITRIESQQNFYKQNNEKSTQQYILFIEVH